MSEEIEHAKWAWAHVIIISVLFVSSIIGRNNMPFCMLIAFLDDCLCGGHSLECNYAYFILHRDDMISPSGKHGTRGTWSKLTFLKFMEVIKQQRNCLLGQLLKRVVLGNFGRKLKNLAD